MGGGAMGKQYRGRIAGNWWEDNFHAVDSWGLLVHPLGSLDSPVLPQSRFP